MSVDRQPYSPNALLYKTTNDIACITTERGVDKYFCKCVVCPFRSFDFSYFSFSIRSLFLSTTSTSCSRITFYVLKKISSFKWFSVCVCCCCCMLTAQLMTNVYTLLQQLIFINSKYIFNQITTSLFKFDLCFVYGFVLTINRSHRVSHALPKRFSVCASKLPYLFNHASNLNSTIFSFLLKQWNYFCFILIYFVRFRLRLRYTNTTDLNKTHNLIYLCLMFIFDASILFFHFLLYFQII